MKRKVLSIVALLASGMTFVQGQVPSIGWDIITVKDPLQSSGFLDVNDLNGDGKLEIIHSTLMEEGGAMNPETTKGSIRVFSMGEDLYDEWDENIVLSTSEDLPFLNDPQAFDVDGDGHLDILVQQGFIRTNGGSHQWLKGPDFTERFNFSPETTHGNTDYLWHESAQADLDGDGRLDIVTTSAQTQEDGDQLDYVNAKIEWYRHLGDGEFEHYVINDSLGGVFLKLYDIDNDGDMDIIVSQFFWGTDRPALVWLEQVEAPAVSNDWKGVWDYHVIDHTTGLGYSFQFYDLTGDGNDELVYVNHNNQDNMDVVDGNGDPIMPGLFYFDIPADPKSSSQWTKHTIYDGFRTNLFDFGNPASQGCPGIFDIGDVDGNGYADIVVPGDGNDTLYLFRQDENNVFHKEILDDDGKMYGMVKVKDLDGDGTYEIVASKHNFVSGFFEAIIGNPPGFLRIYKPILSLPTPTITVDGSLTICEGESVTLSVDSNHDVLWSTGETTHSIEVTTSGTYTVQLINGEMTSDDAEEVMVEVLPSADVAWNAPLSLCVNNEELDLTTLVTGGTGGDWSGNGVTGITFNPSGFEGTEVEITYTIVTGTCVAEETHMVDIIPEMMADWTAPEAICDNEDLDLATLLTGDTGGTWSGDGVSGNMFNPAGLSGDVEVTYAVGEGNCANSLAATIAVELSLNPVIEEEDGVLTVDVTGESYQWYLDGVAIDGATDQSITPTTSGDYSVTVTNGVCESTSDEFLFEVLSLNENAVTGMNLYPNPANDEVSLNLGELNEGLVLVYDAKGVLVQQIEANQQVVAWSVANYDTGSYFVRVYNAQNLHLSTLKLVVK